MTRTIVTFAAAAGLLAGVTTAGAMPMMSQTAGAAPQVTLVYGGCGPYAHRGPYGGCRPGGQWGGYGAFGVRACPPGFHLGPFGRRCWPNY